MEERQLRGFQGGFMCLQKVNTVILKELIASAHFYPAQTNLSVRRDKMNLRLFDRDDVSYKNVSSFFNLKKGEYFGIETN